MPSGANAHGKLLWSPTSPLFLLNISRRKKLCQVVQFFIMFELGEEDGDGAFAINHPDFLVNIIFSESLWPAERKASLRPAVGGNCHRDE